MNKKNISPGFQYSICLNRTKLSFESSTKWKQIPNQEQNEKKPRIVKKLKQIIKIMKTNPQMINKLKIKALSQLRICRPILLRSGHLVIQDAQWAETIDVLKISYRIITRSGAMSVQNMRFGHPKIQFSSKGAQFTGQIGFDLTIIIRIDDFLCDY